MIVQWSSQDLKIKYINIRFWLSSLKKVFCVETQCDLTLLIKAFKKENKLFWKFKMGALFYFTLAWGCNNRLLKQSSALVFLEFWLLWSKYRTIGNIYQHTGKEHNRSSLLTSQKRMVYCRFQASPSLRFGVALYILITWNLFMLTSQLLPVEIMIHKC